MTSSDLLATFDRLGHPRLLVVGDPILDRYTWGDAERISQEAPVVVLRADRREARLGGAASVCRLLRGLEAEVHFAGIVGDDADGQTLRNLLNDEGVDTAGLLVDTARPTTVKERFVGRASSRHPHQILRVDSEVREPLRREQEDELLRLITDRIEEYQTILISDYGKGVCTPRLLKMLFDAADAAGVPAVVDPIRCNDYSRYWGATTMTPNRLETEAATGRKILTHADAVLAGRELCSQANLEMAIITLDRDGMTLVGRDADGQNFPVRPRDLYDITGAGDMVLATIGVCLAAAASPEDSLRLANVAASLEVEKVGVAIVTREEMRHELLLARPSAVNKCVTLDEMARLADRERQLGRRIVLTNGCFDLLHVGHMTYLEEAAGQGDVLIVSVNSDESIRRLKGPSRPIIAEADRTAMLAALACVDYVLTFTEDTPHELLNRIRPDVLVKGGTYTPDEVVGHEVVEAYGGRIHVAGLVDGVSTTKILSSVTEAHVLKGPHLADTEEAPATPKQTKNVRGKDAA